MYKMSLVNSLFTRFIHSSRRCAHQSRAFTTESIFHSQQIGLSHMGSHVQKSQENINMCVNSHFLSDTKNMVLSDDTTLLQPLAMDISQTNNFNMSNNFSHVGVNISDITNISPSLPQPLEINCPSAEVEDIEIQALKRTYQPHVIRKKRRHGFLHRNSTTSGRNILSRRRVKGRRSLSA